MRSAEAVSVVTASDPLEIGRAAATIGALVLEEIEEICRGGEELRDSWESRLAPLPFRAAPEAGPASGATTIVDL
jgi:hypothetical protein